MEVMVYIKIAKIIAQILFLTLGMYLLLHGMTEKDEFEILCAIGFLVLSNN